MDYTKSDAHTVHAPTGNRLHQEDRPVTTAVSASDMNMLIWSMMAVVKAAGLSGVEFDPDEPATYQQFLRAQNILFGREAYTPVDTRWRAVGDGTADDTAALAAFFKDIPNNCVADGGGRTFRVYVGVTGVPSGNALPLANVLRLFNKRDITLRNFEIRAASPGVSGLKLRYPSTLAIDACSGIQLENVKLYSKGENYGDADASESLDAEARRDFLAQNGGHALVIIRSKGVRGRSSDFVKAGSCGAFYLSSSDAVVLDDCYASAHSLGYAAFAADAWCGSATVAGFAKFELILNNCRTDAGEATYGSKGCVVAEDADVIVRVNGGVYKDAYANGSATWLGAAFSACSCTVIVNNAQVDNCASIGGTTQTSLAQTHLEVNGVTATKLRTSVHIQASTSFGASVARYSNTNYEVVGTSLWPQTELSIPTVVANRKVASVFNIEMINVVGRGAHTFAINTRACYGGIRVVGGLHVVTDRIFDSNGWGGASAGTQRGYELLGAARFDVQLADTAVVSTAKTQATTAINAIKNQDVEAVTTYQVVAFDRSVTVVSNLFREFISVSGVGAPGIVEKLVLAQQLVSCYQATRTAGEACTTEVRVVSNDVLTGSAAKVTLALLGNKIGGAGTFADDLGMGRRIQSFAAAPVVVGTELRVQALLNKNAYDLTPGTVYPIAFTG